MATTVVIDYGMGNLRSVSKALEHVSEGSRIEITSDPGRVRQADRVVLPGVGALRDCMTELARLELIPAIRDVLRTRPFLGICLGMQALLDFSDENDGTPGLGVIAGAVKRFGDATNAAGARLKVPHMGWSPVDQVGTHPLWKDIATGSRFYFVHSYYVVPDDTRDVAATTGYGETFASALARDNIFAVQFHPEKSQQAGLTLLANFLRWNGSCR
ncbi:MAG: glutamine amidotransferase [Gammaproteobacteria bacterium]|nr:MAG: glutamine amidotransferase [Gammaproteobacteria bacterium]TND06272.1 MAG: glutamine amidotransferase [Gammaproteobacteria bacterium]